MAEEHSMNGPKDSKKNHYYISRKGMHDLLILSQQGKTQDLAEYMGIRLIGYKYVHKEPGTIHNR